MSTIGRLHQDGTGWDFELPDTALTIALQRGAILSTLDTDRKPIFNTTNCISPLPVCDGTMAIHSPSTFERWFRPSLETIPFTKELELYKQPDGMWSFGSAAFFPIDDVGFGKEGFGHNHAFTTELHTVFVYRGDEGEFVCVLFYSLLSSLFHSSHPRVPHALSLTHTHVFFRAPILFLSSFHSLNSSHETKSSTFTVMMTSGFLSMVSARSTWAVFTPPSAVKLTCLFSSEVLRIRAWELRRPHS